MSNSYYELDLNKFYPESGSKCLNSLDGLLFFEITDWCLFLSEAYILFIILIVDWRWLNLAIIYFSLKLYISPSFTFSKFLVFFYLILFSFTGILCCTWLTGEKSSYLYLGDGKLAAGADIVLRFYKCRIFYYAESDKLMLGY